MTCKELVEVITEYLEGTLPAEDRARFERHLAECDGCHAYLARCARRPASLGQPAAAESLSSPLGDATAHGRVRRLCLDRLSASRGRRCRCDAARVAT